ncbi:hypothetical protein [Haloarchaeobius sp. DFWS5]|uniref:hypothetical protein n=1 Tax=Haloarchaeobius sp. DFWS5 TaxID=3446114 RepID=UPI003EBCEEAD
MRRRAFLSSLTRTATVCGLVATTGCLAELQTTFGGESGPIAAREFTVVEPASDDFDAAPAVEEPPRVSFDNSRYRVQVVGRLHVGSGTCDEAKLVGASHDADSDLLHLTVGSGQKRDPPDYCTADESVDAYRATITFEERLPGRVLARERGHLLGTETTVERPTAE